MSWEFETDPEFQEKLTWVEEFVQAEVEPIDHLVADPYDLTDSVRRRLIPPLQEAVRGHQLWSCHLGPEYGGQGYGQVKLSLLNEILGRSRCAPIVFGAQAPDSGNAEILAKYGSPELRKRFLLPLLRNEIVSCFSITEPSGGSDPTRFVTSAVLDGDEWVLNGEKWFSTNARQASFYIVMAATDPDKEPHERMSMFIVPKGTPGVSFIRHVGVAGSTHTPSHSYVRYENVRVPQEFLLGERGGAFKISQTRLAGGRIHHAMRTVGLARRALDMMCERAVSREIGGQLLSQRQLIQAMVAESWAQLEQFRLLVLQTAWRIDRYQDYKKVRRDIAAVKVVMPRVLNDIASRALQVHGSLGVSTEMPFMEMISTSHVLALADGPTEVHLVDVARSLFRETIPVPGYFPSGHLPTLRLEAIARLGIEPEIS